MTRRDYASAVAVYGGALLVLAAVIGGWIPVLTIGAICVAAGLIALNERKTK